MQNLRTSANKGSNDAYDVSTSLTPEERLLEQTTPRVEKHNFFVAGDALKADQTQMTR